MKKPKIIILTPGVEAIGGLANYYRVLRPLLPSNIKCFVRGARKQPYRKSVVFEWARIIRDFSLFFFTLVFSRVHLVQVTTSLGVKSVYRDGLFILMAKLFRCKVIVFFRGWSVDREREVEQRGFKFFKYAFGKASAFMVLASEVEITLKKWGFQQDVVMETTLVDSNIINSINVEDIKLKFNISKPLECLFLARIEEYKGIVETIKAFAELQNQGFEFKLTIAGSGSYDHKARQLVKELELKHCTFMGFVDGDDKLKVLLKSQVYIFPSYNEGMPNSLLEAMGAGLVVVTTNVGGVIDFFESGKMGFVVEKKNVESLVDCIKGIYEKDSKQLSEMALYNHLYATNNFSSSVVAQRLISIFTKYIL